MSGPPKIIWPHPSPLHDWWTQVMAAAAARLHTSDESTPKTTDTESSLRDD